MVRSPRSWGVFVCAGSLAAFVARLEFRVRVWLRYHAWALDYFCRRSTGSKQASEWVVFAKKENWNVMHLPLHGVSVPLVRFFRLVVFRLRNHIDSPVWVHVVRRAVCHRVKNSRSTTPVDIEADLLCARSCSYVRRTWTRWGTCSQQAKTSYWYRRDMQDLSVVETVRKFAKGS